MTDPQPDFRPVPGVAEEVAQSVRRIVAPNPSPMTFRGTNTYVLGTKERAVIDPGPDDADHLAAILDACGDDSVTAILVTHAHLDHSPLAKALKAATGARIFAYSDASGGRSAIMERLAAQGMVGGGEGVDAAFQPDVTLASGDTVDGWDWSLQAIHTPGDFGNHLAFSYGDQLFCGDLVMGWASSLVSPPDGDLTDFMTSCRTLRAQDWSVFHPGHGAPIYDPGARLDWLIAHRETREASILAALKGGPATSRDLAERIYTDTPKALLPAAARNVLAHLIDLYGKSRVAPVGDLTADALFELL